METDDRASSKQRPSSPSALSTASSGSPLVRQGSDASSLSSVSSLGSSGDGRQLVAACNQSPKASRRPAPTSIAAAQMQLHQQQIEKEQHQQQHQSTGATKKLLANGNKLAQFVNLNHGATLSNGSNNNKCQKSPTSETNYAAHRPSAGANSMARKAANSYWPVATKLRYYLNLNCLLIALICLATVLLVSQRRPAASDHLASESAPDKLEGARGPRSRTLRTNGAPAAEPLESDASFGGLGGDLRRATGGVADPRTKPAAGSSLFDDDDDGESSSNNNNNTPPASNQTNRDLDGEQQDDDESRRRGDPSDPAKLDGARQPLNTQLGRMFEDLGGLLAKSLALQGRNRLADAGNATGERRHEIIRSMRTKDGSGGATIVISASGPFVSRFESEASETSAGADVSAQAASSPASSSSGNATNGDATIKIVAGEPTIPMLLERLLPPSIFRPPSMSPFPFPFPFSGGGGGAQPAGGLIRLISAGPSGDSMAPSTMIFAAPSMQAVARRQSVGASPWQQHAAGGASLFGQQRLEFGGGGTLSPLLPPGLMMSLMMMQRESQLANNRKQLDSAAEQEANELLGGATGISPDSELEEDEQWVAAAPAGGRQQQAGVNSTGETLAVSTGKQPIAQASDLHLASQLANGPANNQTTNATTNSNEQPNNSNDNNDNDDDEFETFNVNANGASKQPPPRAAGSVLVISSSSSQLMPPAPGSIQQLISAGSGRAPFVFNQWPAPTASLADSGGSATVVPVVGGQSGRILRAILANLVSDLVSDSADSRAARPPARGGANSRAGLAATPSSRRNSLASEQPMQDHATHLPDDWTPLRDPEQYQHHPHNHNHHLHNHHHHKQRQLRNRLDDQLDTQEAQTPASSFLDHLFAGGLMTSMGAASRQQQQQKQQHQQQSASHHLPRAYRNNDNNPRSQSLSHMDLAPEMELGEAPETPEGSAGNRVPFARIMFGGGEPSNTLQSPVGLIGRLLDDLKFGGAQSPAAGRRPHRRLSEVAGGAGESPIEDDLDETDNLAAQQPPRAEQVESRPGWAPSAPPRVRVGSARIRISPMVAHRRLDHVSSGGGGPMMQPNHHVQLSVPLHFSVPANHQLEQHEQSHVPPAPPSNGPPAESQHDQLIGLAPKSSIAASIAHNKYLEQSTAAHQLGAGAGSPFTSPSSPLFGFPLMDSRELEKLTKDQDQENQSAKAQMATHDEESATQLKDDNHKAAVGSDRRQRAFVYHSNHELAPGVHAQQQRSQFQHHHQNQQRSSELNEQPQAASMNGVDETISRPKFVLPPPAAVAMGRRLDDGPFAAQFQEPTME